MSMNKIYVVVESYQDYKGASTYVCGASKTYEDAQEIMRDAVEDRFDYKFDDEEFDFEQFYKEHGGGGDVWEDDAIDDVIRFEIQETNLI